MTGAPSPAFVAGATGYVGHALVRLLAERGARVAAHVRPDSPRLGQWRERLMALGSTVEVDTTPWDEAAMTATLAARTAGEPPRLVYLSSVGVTPDTRNPYLRARARMESELREGELPFTIARPSVITGADREESRPMERVAAVVMDAALALPGLLGAERLRDRWRSTTADELARALVRLSIDPRAAGAVVEGDALRD